MSSGAAVGWFTCVQRWFAGTPAPCMTTDETAADRRLAEIVVESAARAAHRANRALCLSCEAGIQAPHEMREA